MQRVALDGFAQTDREAVEVVTHDIAVCVPVTRQLVCCEVSDVVGVEQQMPEVDGLVRCFVFVE